MDNFSNLNAESVRWILIGLFVLIASVAIHEFGHAKMADLLGDDTPRRQGRVTLNPIAHIDWIGTVLLPVIGGVYSAAGGRVGGFGWGKPVQWNPARIDRKHRMATAQILVAVAGPAMNVVLAVLVAVVQAILRSQHVIGWYGEVDQILSYTITTNFILFFFNLMPAPPLDGGHVLGGFMPYKHRDKFDAYARYGPFVFLALVMIPQLAKIFVIPAQWCAEHVQNGFGSLFGA